MKCCYIGLADIAISQPCSCFRNNILPFRSENHFRSRLVLGNDKGLGLGLGLASSFSSRSSCITGREGSRSYTLARAEVWRGGLVTIKAVATLEITSVPRKERVKGYTNVLRMDIGSASSSSSSLETPQSSSEDESAELDEREKLRRMRISNANRGNTPWNKGRKHRPETVQLIKERTRLAMQDPKVKMKLVNLGHAQSEETKIKIGVGVRLGWERRRERLQLQETCHHQWQDLIAVAARKGFLGEEELQWDSYKVLSKQLEKEWVQSVEERRNAPRIKGSKRAPKSAEQKRKISEAIAAKWADPEYRDRVYSGLAKFHGIPEGTERKPRRKTSIDGQSRKRGPKNTDETDNLAKSESKSQNQRTRTKRSKTPSYKDPLASSKLEMLKNIRAQRSAVLNKKSEAVTRAKLLIAGAEKAAEALEIAARENPLAQASLMESRMLIAEAYQIIESIEYEDEVSSEDDKEDNSENSIESVQNLELVMDENSLNLANGNLRKVNGVHSISSASSAVENDNFSFDKFMLQDLMNGNGSASSFNDILETEEKLHSNGLHSPDHKPSPNGISVQTQKQSLNGLDFQPDNADASSKKQVNTVKKWLRGRLVEVAEET
ncbi:hypothetical protein ACP275_09G139900 [Erythranthe tilingii]